MNEQLHFDDFLNRLSEIIAEKLSAKIQNNPTPAPEPEEVWLNTEEAMQFLRVKSPVTWKKYRKTGRIPEGKMIGGRRLYWKKSDLLKAL